ncbi:MAG: Zn-ribbon domain-containing protein [Nanoarchaeota archaeon]|nr:Zn-ribbon domain-containing protein [Nanoarchaeota archaeon]
MPHQCVRCGVFHEDGSDALLKGCGCGSNFFFFIRKEHLEKAKEVTVKLDDVQRKEIEKDVFKLIGGEIPKKPVILDIESIRVLKPGQYEISLVDLFNNKPLVYRIEEGKYVIDLVQTFESMKHEEKKKDDEEGD